MAACQRGPTAEQEETISNLIPAGFPENGSTLTPENDVPGIT